MGIRISGDFMRLAVLAFAIALTSLASAADASLITTTVKVTGTGFDAWSGSAVPVDPVVGVFTFTLDPNQVYSDQTLGLKVDSLNIAYAGPATWKYDGHGGVTIAGDSTVNSLTWGTDDFFLSFQLIDMPLYDTEPYWGYTNHSVVDYFDTYNVTIQQLPTPTPIPAALPLFVSALGGLGFMGWRRKQGATV